MRLVMVDLSDFEREYGEALEAAAEFARRKEKGIPSDRWADGHVGAVNVAIGIRAMQAIMAMQSQVISEMFADMQHRGTDATRIYGEHSKYKDQAP